MFNIYFFEHCNAPRKLVYTSENPNSDIVIPSTMNLKTDGGDNLDLTMYVNNPFYNRFQSMKNEVAIEENGVIIYRGRILSSEENYESDGTVSKIVTLSGHETYFNDISFATEGFRLENNKLSTILSTLFKSIESKGKYSLYFKKNSFSDKVISLQLDDAITAAANKQVSVCFEKFEEYHKFFFLSTHSYKDDKNKIGIETVMECIPYESVLENKSPMVFLYGKHVTSIEKKSYYDKICNVIIVGFGEKAFIPGVGISMHGSEESRVLHGEFSRTKEEKEILNLESANTIALGCLNKYKNPRYEVSCEFIDTRLIEFKEPSLIGIGDIVELRNTNGDLIFKDIIAEINYNPLEPQKKKLTLGIEKLNLFKNYEL